MDSAALSVAGGIDREAIRGCALFRRSLAQFARPVWDGVRIARGYGVCPDRHIRLDRSGQRTHSSGSFGVVLTSVRGGLLERRAGRGGRVARESSRDFAAGFTMDRDGVAMRSACVLDSSGRWMGSRGAHAKGRCGTPGAAGMAEEVGRSYGSHAALAPGAAAGVAARAGAIRGRMASSCDPDAGRSSCRVACGTD